MKITLDKNKPIDIMIVSEGTYPYVRGGVSSWIHQLMNGLSHLNYGIIFVGSHPEEYDTMKYDLPENLVFMLEAFMFDFQEEKTIKPKKGSKKALKNVQEIYSWFKSQKNGFPKQLYSLDFYLKEVDEDFFLYSESAWEFISAMYEKNSPQMAFIDYFWTVRSIHAPIWKLAKIAKTVEGKARVIHTPSTGYAGFLGALLSRHDDIPLILTEHGIYTKERKIDLLSNDFFASKKFDLMKQFYENDHIKEMWIRFFEGIGYFCYDQSEPVLSLFQGAKKMQITYGANPDICEVIPNGVDTKKLHQAYTQRESNVPQVVTLIGRVVSIKDIKTFIRAIKVASDTLPNIEGWIVGPTDEDKEYAHECMKLVENLELQDHIKFLGFQNILDVLPKTGILTLTSISEGMPLVILEGFAAGVPCVATDVGSCKELIEGALHDEDIALGKAGEVVEIANSAQLASAYVSLLQEESLWKQYQKNALERVNRYYTQEAFFQSYLDIYEKALFGQKQEVVQKELAWQA